MMTYAMARWYQLEKTCGTPIFIFITHIVTMPVQYLMILNFIIRSIQSSTSIAFSAPDNLFISHHNYLLHGYQLYLRCDYTFIPDLMSYTLNFILPCLHSLTVTSLSCGNLDPGKTCPNPGPTTTTSICWRDLFCKVRNFHPNLRSRKAQNRSFNPEPQEVRSSSLTL